MFDVLVFFTLTNKVRKLWFQILLWINGSFTWCNFLDHSRNRCCTGTSPKTTSPWAGSWRRRCPKIELRTKKKFRGKQKTKKPSFWSSFTLDEEETTNLWKLNLFAIRDYVTQKDNCVFKKFNHKYWPNKWNNSIIEDRIQVRQRILFWR